MFNTSFKWGGVRTPRQFPLIAAVAALLLFIAAIVLSGCAGGGGSSGDGNDGDSLNISLVAPTSSSRAAYRALYEPGCSVTVALFGDYKEIQTATIGSDGKASITFSNVPVGSNITIVAAVTENMHISMGIKDGYSVVSGTNNVSIALASKVFTEQNGNVMYMDDNGSYTLDGQPIPLAGFTYSQTDNACKVYYKNVYLGEVETY